MRDVGHAAVLAGAVLWATAPISASAGPPHSTQLDRPATILPDQVFGCPAEDIAPATGWSLASRSFGFRLVKAEATQSPAVGSLGAHSDLTCTYEVRTGGAFGGHSDPTATFVVFRQVPSLCAVTADQQFSCKASSLALPP